MPFNAESITTIIKEGLPALEILAGSKAAAMFIEKVSGALGWYLEPKQTIRKARAEAVASVIKAESDQEVKSLSERAVARIIHEETGHQQNMEAIVLSALPGIKEDAKPNDIDDDWMANFFNKSRNISNEEMQKLWAQILAGEANEPGSYSHRTVNFLASMTKYDAEVFRKFATYIWRIDGSGSVAIIFNDMMPGKALPNAPYSSLLYLSELGVIGINNNVNGLTLEATGKKVIYNGRAVTVEEHQMPGTKRLGFPVGNIVLSNIGKELFKICEPTADWDYYDKVLARWEKGQHPVIRQMNE
ncbi:MAG: hypothetical protein JWP58_246 [Hymenobacter sp.]|nr:hypothetical protein [Hymenobacter sp.]